MQNFFPVLVILFGLLSCKTTWNVHDIKTENTPNSERITEIDVSVVQLVAPYKNILEADMQQIVGFSPVEQVKAKPESRLTNYLGDMIVGRHTHAFMDERLQLKNADGKLIIVNQAGWAGLMLSSIDFLFDPAKLEKPVVYPQKSQSII